MTRKDEADAYYKLRKIRDKITRFEHHYFYLTACVMNDCIANGLKINKQPIMAERDVDFCGEWESILLESSKKLQEITIVKVEELIEHLNIQEETLKKEIVDRLGENKWDEISNHVVQITAKQESTLERRRQKKLGKLGVVDYNQKQEDVSLTESQRESVYLRIENFLKDIGIGQSDVNDTGPQGGTPTEITKGAVVLSKQTTNLNVNNDKGDLSKVKVNNDRSTLIVTTGTSGELESAREEITTTNGNNKKRDLNKDKGMNIVVNLSSRVLTSAEENVLSRGLNFYPTHG